MSAAKMIVLTYKLNIDDTLTTRRNIVKIKKFKKINNLQNDLRKEQKNTKTQRLLNQRCRFDDDFTTRKI